MLGWLGAPVGRDGFTTTIDGPAGFAARDIVVPGDISSAAAWLVAGAIHPDARSRLEDVGLNPSRLAIIEVLREMGADIEVDAGRGRDDASRARRATSTVRGGRRLRADPASTGARVADLIDELPLLAVAMAAADGPQRAARRRASSASRSPTGSRSSSRTCAAIGVDAEERQDGWVVQPGHAARGRDPRPRATTASRWPSRSPR